MDAPLPVIAPQEEQHVPIVSPPVGDTPNKLLSSRIITLILLVILGGSGVILTLRLFAIFTPLQTGSEFEIAGTPVPTPQVVIPQWKMFNNPQFNYSIQHPPDTEPIINPPSDVYRHFVTFVQSSTDNTTDEVTNTELFSLSLRNATLDEEVQFQKSRIEKHVPLVVTNQQTFTHLTYPAVRIDYTSASGSGELLSFIIVDKPPYAFTLYFPNLKDASLVEQVLSTLQIY